MAEPLPCRSLAEAQLYLELIGAEQGDRGPRLEMRDGDLVCVFPVTVDGEHRAIVFLAPEDPGSETEFGGAEPSELIDAGQWLEHADRLARSVPSDPAGMESAAREAVARRLDEAARCVDEVVKFIPEGQEEVPEGAFWTPSGKDARRRERERFERARLGVVAATCRDVAARFHPPPATAGGAMDYLYHLHANTKQLVANYFEPGMHRSILSSHDDFGDWTILLDEPNRVLMRHYNGAMMWVTLADDKLVSYELVEGDAAKALDERYGGG